MKLKIGDIIENFNYNTAYEENKNYFNDKKDKKEVLAFLRYYGCTVCQLDIMEFNQLYEEFKKLNTDVKIVLQSSPSIIKAADKDKKIAFEIICDPEQKLYKLFEVKAAENLEELISGNIKEKASEAKKIGFSHGEYEGNELQLPALFIIDEYNRVIYSKYAKDGADIPRAKEVLEFIKNM